MVKMAAVVFRYLFLMLILTDFERLSCANANSPKLDPSCINGQSIDIELNSCCAFIVQSGLFRVRAELLW